MTRGRGRNPGASTLNKHIKRKEHKERAQPAARQKLGQLEKHKDYVLRAKKRRAKVERLAQIKRAVAQRNPDEFHIGMTHAVMDVATGTMKKRRGRRDPEARVKALKDTLRHNATNVQYLEFKAQGDRQRVTELLNEDAATAALTTGRPTNKHVVFVDSEEEFRRFDPLKHFDATPEMLRQHPALRGTLSVLKSTVLPEEVLLSGNHVKSASQRRKERRELQAKLRKSGAKDAAERQAIVDRVKAKREVKRYRFSDLVQEAIERGAAQSTTSSAQKASSTTTTAAAAAGAAGANDDDDDAEDEADDATRLLAWRREKEEEAALQSARRMKEVTQRMERSKSLHALAKIIRKQNEGVKKQMAQRRENRFRPNVPRRAR